MKKQLTKEIKILAKKLPDSYVEGTAYQKRTIEDLRGREIRNQMFGSNLEQTISSENETIIVKGTKLFKVNHERRIKRAYQRDGITGIKEYVKWVTTNNKNLNMKYQNAILLNVVNEKVKASIETIFS